MGKHTVPVGDKYYEVLVIQHSKTVWRATGEFYGKPIEVKGGSAAQALEYWRSAAAAAYDRQ